MRSFAFSCLLVAAVAFCGCSSGDGGSGGSGGGGQVTPLSVTPETAIPTAGASAAVASFGAQFGSTLTAVFGALASAPAASESLGLKALITTPVSGLCQSGTATANWDDTDDSSTLSEGDSAELLLDGCTGSGLSEAAVTGSVEVTIARADGGLPSGGGSARGPATMSLTIATDPSTTIAGEFEVDINAPSLSTINLGLGDQQDTDELTLIQGSLELELSCFSIFQRIFPANDSVVFFRPIGLALVNSQQFTLNSYALGEAPSIDWQAGVPTSGSLNVFSGASSDAPCSSNGPAGDGSSLTATVVSEGQINIEGQDASSNVFSCSTTWNQLLDLDFITSGVECSMTGTGGTGGMGGGGGAGGSNACGADQECTQDAPSICGTICIDPICGGDDNFDTAGCGDDNRCVCICVEGLCSDPV